MTIFAPYISEYVADIGQCEIAMQQMTPEVYPTLS